MARGSMDKLETDMQYSFLLIIIYSPQKMHWMNEVGKRDDV